MYSNNFRKSSGNAKPLQTGIQPQYRVNFTLAVSDVHALWAAAAARLLEAPGMTPDDVVEMIGPREDPAISDCIATLAKPDAMAGCLLDDFWIDGFAKTPPRLDAAATLGDARSETAERKPRRMPKRRAVVPALHLLVTPPTKQTRLD